MFFIGLYLVFRFILLVLIHLRSSVISSFKNTLSLSKECIQWFLSLVFF